MLKQFADNVQQFLMTGLLLVGVYLVVTHGDQATAFVRTGFSGVNTLYKTLQGR